MPAFPLRQAFQGIADANGSLTLQGGPLVANESWEINHIDFGNPGPRTPTLALYKNVVANLGFVDQTLNGLFGCWDGSLRLQSSELLIAVFTLCTAGTSCSIVLEGTKYCAF